MKKSILTLSVFFFALSIYAQEPLIKFHLLDGSIITKNVSDIASLTFEKAVISSYMKINYKPDSLAATFDSKYIDSIKIDEVLKELYVYQDNGMYIYNISKIESIIFEQKNQRFIDVRINKNIPNLTQLKLSSSVEFDKIFDNDGYSKLLVNNSRQSQIVFVSNPENKPIAMGLVKSNDKDIYIDGISSIAVMVYNNAIMMGLPIENCVDSVADFIYNLPEVHQVGAIVQDTINDGKPFLNAVDDNLKIILRSAYIKTYEYATGDKYEVIQGKINIDSKENNEQLLSDEVPVTPQENAGIHVSAKKIDNVVKITIENKKKRHINIRLNDVNGNIIKLGPVQSITGSIFSKYIDEHYLSNKVTIDYIDDKTISLEACGPAFGIGKYGNVYPDKFDPFYYQTWARTTSSLLGAPLSMVLNPLSSTIKTSEIIINSLEYVNDVTEINDYIKANDMTSASFLTITTMVRHEAFLTTLLSHLRPDLPFDMIEEWAGQISAHLEYLISLWDIGWFLVDVTYIDEHSVFYIKPPSNDVTPPTIEILSLTSKNIPKNSIIPIEVKITDNENVNLAKLIIDYDSKNPVVEVDFGSNAGKEVLHTFNWDNSGLSGYHYITVNTKDEAGNSKSAMKIINIIANPDDKEPSVITLNEPIGNEIPSDGLVEFQVKCTDNDKLHAFGWYMDEPNNPYGNFRYFDVSKSNFSERLFEFDVNTTGFKEGEVHKFYCYVVDGGENKTTFEKEYIVKNNDNEYGTVTIGTQVWMKRNLDVTHYRNGDEIRHAVTKEEWIDAGNKKEGAWCYYDNDPANGVIYGKLYNWDAVNDSRGLAPSGYHVPTDAEWTTLTRYLKSNSQYWCNNNSKNIAKSLASKELWNTDSYSCTVGNNLNANNTNGFTALPGGCRYGDGTFLSLRNFGIWWSVTEYDAKFAWHNYLCFNDVNVYRDLRSKVVGYSVRCVKDNSSGILQITSISPTSAKIGDEIIITGSGFNSTQGTSFVSFNDVKATEYQSWSDTEIIVKVPTGAATGKISVTINGTKSNEVDFTVNKSNPGDFETVTIGTQVWMKKNLDVTTYRNGDAIRHAVTKKEWEDAGNKNEGAWCYYDNDPANGAVYGKLYNWYAVNDSRGLAPSGWHVPSDWEWTLLETYLSSNSQYWCNNSSTYIAKSLASKELWNIYSSLPCTIGNNLNANNTSGFSALPGGCNTYNGYFSDLNEGGFWWSSTEFYDKARYRILYDHSPLVFYHLDWKALGFSVRCVKD